MSLLGLEDYGSNSEESPAPGGGGADAAPAAAAGSGRNLLSVVEYGAEADAAELAAERKGVPPTIKLDDAYKFVDAMETLIPNGSPSLIGCKSMKIEGNQ